MPPRPNDKGALRARSNSPNDSKGGGGTPDTSMRQMSNKSQEFSDISSHGEDEDDFIGNDSYDGSPEGSWDSSGNGGTSRMEGDDKQSTQDESQYGSDEYTEHDTSSGSEGYEQEYQEQLVEQGQRECISEMEVVGVAWRNTSNRAGEYEQGAGVRDSETKGETYDQSGQPASNTSSLSPPSESAVGALPSQSSDVVPSHASESAGEQYNDDHEADAYDANAGKNKRQGTHTDARSDHLEAAVEPDNSFEKESDEDDLWPSDQNRKSGCTDSTASEHQENEVLRAESAEIGGNPSAISIAAPLLDAQSFMQGRLSQHLLTLDSSEDDDEETPRLPSLSARTRKREQEQELLMVKAVATKNALNISASEEEGGATPRLEIRNIIVAQDETEDEKNRMIVDTNSKAAGQADEDVAVHSSVKTPPGDFSEGQKIVLCSDAAAEGQFKERVFDDGLGKVVTQIVAQAIADAGGFVPEKLLAELALAGPPEKKQNFSDSGHQQVMSLPADSDQMQREEGLSTERIPAAPSASAFQETSNFVFQQAEDDADDVVRSSMQPRRTEIISIQEYSKQETKPESNISDRNRANTSDTPEDFAREPSHDAHQQQSHHPNDDLQTDVFPDLYLCTGTIGPSEKESVFANYSMRTDGTQKASTHPTVQDGCPETQQADIQSTKQTRFQSRDFQPEVVAGEASQDFRPRSRAVISQTSSQENIFMGRPDWNFDSVKYTTQKKTEKYRYVPPVPVPNSKWVRAGSITPERSPSPEAILNSSSRGDIQKENSKESVMARAKDYWENMVRSPDGKKKRSSRRPGTSQSSLESFRSGSHDASITSERSVTSEGYAARFRYNVTGVRGGTFSRGQRKDDVDVLIREAATRPGVGEYNVVREDSTLSNSTTGKMLGYFEAVGSSEWTTKKKRYIPGPDQYGDMNPPLRAPGGRFGQGKRWKQDEVFEQRSRELPGPLDYEGGDARDKAYKRVNGGLISDANVKSELDWTLLRGSRTPGPSTYKLPPVSSTMMRTKGGKMDRSAPKPKYSETPGPGAYFSQSAADVEKEISVQRSKSRNSVASSRGQTSCSRDSLSRDSQEVASKGPNRRTIFDDVQDKASKMPGPATYQVNGHSLSKKTSRQPLERVPVISRPGTSDPVVYCVGNTERSSIVSDYRTIQSLQRSWADSASNFKSMLDNFISVRLNSEGSEISLVQYTKSHKDVAFDKQDHLITSPFSEGDRETDTREGDSVFVTSQIY